MRRLIVLVLIVVAANVQAGWAQQPGAKSPSESLKCMLARPGFTVELMAAEPLVKSPIAFAWGPDGRTLNGMIASETSTSVTLVGIDGKSHALLRNAAPASR